MKLLQFNLNDTRLERLVQENYGLLVSQALRFKPKNKEALNDCIQIAVLAFIKAVDKYDPVKAKFSTYISNCIKNALCDNIKKEKKHVFVSLPKEVITIPSEEFWELIPDNLTSLEKSVIMLKLENYTKTEIALILDCSQKYVVELFKKAKHKIKMANE